MNFYRLQFWRPNGSNAARSLVGRGSRAMRGTGVVVALALATGCSASHPGRPTAGRNLDGDGPPVTTYASASGSARTVLDRSGLEPVVEQAHARLAVGQHVVVAGDSAPSTLSEIAFLGDKAVAAVDDMDARTFHGRVLILAPATASEYQSWTGGGYGDAWAVTRPPTFQGDHSVITLDLEQHGFDGAPMKDDRKLLRHVIGHEMFHALTLPEGGLQRAPEWLVEGFAELAGAQMSQIPRPEMPWRAYLPTESQFRTSPDAAYFLAWRFADFLRHQEGPMRAMRFYFAAVSRHNRSPANSLSLKYLKSPLKMLVQRWKQAYSA